jgi:hypothetical protein
MFSAAPELVQVQVGMEEQVWEAGMERVTVQVEEQVMQLAQGIPRQGQVRAQGSVIFLPEQRPDPPGLLPRPGHVH